MKLSKREKLMKQLAAVALLLGVFSPLSQAAVSEKDGLSYDDLKKVVQNLEIQQEGTSVIFAGVMPKGCAENAAISYDHKDGKHLATIRMPAFPKCVDDFKALPESEKAAQKVDAADVLAEIKLKDRTGSLHLRHYKEGSRRSANRVSDEELLDVNGKAIAHVGQETREEQEQEQRAQEETAAEKRAREESQKAHAARIKDLHAKVLKFCNDGDYVGLGQEITNASDLLGDVTSLLEKVGINQKAKIKKDLEAATSAEEARAAFEAYVSNASANGWDEDELKTAYIEKRFELLSTLAEDSKGGDANMASVDKEIRSWLSDFRALDGRLFRKKENKDKFAELYGELAAQAMKKKNISQAEKYVDRAKRFSDDADKLIAADGMISKMYAEKFKECVKKNPAKMDACEKQYISKAKERAEAIKETIKGKGGEDAEAELASYQAEFIGTFGGGQTATFTGYGTMHQLPGAVDQFKKQALQEYQQQQQQQMMQRMMGMPAAGAPAQRSSVLGF